MTCTCKMHNIMFALVCGNCKGSGCTNSDQMEYNDEVNDDDEDREHYCRDFKFSAV